MTSYQLSFSSYSFFPFFLYFSNPLRLHTHLPRLGKIIFISLQKHYTNRNLVPFFADKKIMNHTHFCFPPKAPGGFGIDPGKEPTAALICTLQRYPHRAKSPYIIKNILCLFINLCNKKKRSEKPLSFF